jgi:biotin operon repressor
MELKESTNIFKALGDSSRLLIIDILREKPCYVEELAERLNLAESTVSFHLKKLEAGGLVKRVKEQYYVTFHLNKKIFSLTLGDITSFKNHEKVEQDERIQKYAKKVIRAFYRNGKIEKLPSQYKKRLLVLEQLLNDFSPVKTYAETEIDSIVSDKYDDYCTIRRLFIDEKMMTREKGIYRINPLYKHQFPASELKIFSPKKEKNIKMDRSVIKRTYKQTGTAMGVYSLLNSVTGDFYIGSSKNLNGMMNRHRFELSTKIHTIKEIQDTWNDFGEQKLRFEIVDKLEPKDDPAMNYSEELQELENLWIDKLRKEGKKIIRLKTTRVAKEQ